MYVKTPFSSLRMYPGRTRLGSWKVRGSGSASDGIGVGGASAAAAGRHGAGASRRGPLDAAREIYRAAARSWRIAHRPRALLSPSKTRPSR